MRTAVVSFRECRSGPWNAHGFALTDLMAEAFDASVLTMHNPSTFSHQVLAAKGRGLEVLRRLPGRSRVSPTASSVGPIDLLFVVAHDATDLDQLFATEPDWLTSDATKVLVLVEVWANDARSWPASFARVLPHFDAVFCTLEEGIVALQEASGCEVEVMAQAVDVLGTPFRVEPRIDVLTIGRRAPAQHELFERWADETGGWYHYDTLPAGSVADVDLHRKVTATLLAQSAVSVCNYARFDDAARIGSTRGTGTRFFESLASGAIIAGDLPTDDMFTDQFGEVAGIASLPLDCGGLDTDAVAEIVAMGRTPALRRGNRAHALGHQDLAHRVRQILARIDVPEPALIGERFAALEAERAELLQTV
ncbi:MAG: hypothetical protein U0Q22_09260 [Acidimicrobiales bacterium]